MLYVSDLDGTLLNSQGVIGPHTREGLADLLSRGLPFTIATARSVCSAAQLLDGVPLRLPLVELGGAFLSEPSGRHLYTQAIGDALKHGVYLQLQAAGYTPFISTFDGQRDNIYHARIENEGQRWYYQDRVAHADPRLRPARPLMDVLEEQVICFTVIDREEGLRALQQRLTGLYGPCLRMNLMRHLYCPGYSWFTIYDAKATKAHGVKRLMEMLGISAGELTVFGDDINDIDMFSIANHAVAVGNALPQVKEHAHEIIGTNDEDAVANYLENIHTQQNVSFSLEGRKSET